MRSASWRALLPLAWSAAIWWASSGPAPVDVGHNDKLFHCGAFALLATLWFWCLSATALGTPQRWVLGAALATAWGWLDEWHQSFVPARDASVLDALADSAGAIGATVLLALNQRRLARAAESH